LAGVALGVEAGAEVDGDDADGTEAVAGADGLLPEQAAKVTAKMASMAKVGVRDIAVILRGLWAGAGWCGGALS
jgi:hypothetical protein